KPGRDRRGPESGRSYAEGEATEGSGAAAITQPVRVSAGGACHRSDGAGTESRVLATSAGTQTRSGQQREEDELLVSLIEVGAFRCAVPRAALLGCDGTRFQVGTPFPACRRFSSSK